MRVTRIAALTAIGVTAAGVGAAAFVAAAASSSAAPTHTHSVAHTRAAAHAVVRHHTSAAAPKAQASAVAKHVTTKHVTTKHVTANPVTAKSVSRVSSADPVSTSVEQVAWTRRAEADTAPVANKCTPVTGADGKPLQAGGGGFVYPALVNDPRAEQDIASMYMAMSAGDQAAYDAAYHRLDLLVNCN